MGARGKLEVGKPTIIEYRLWTTATLHVPTSSIGAEKSWKRVDNSIVASSGAVVIGAR